MKQSMRFVTLLLSFTFGLSACASTTTATNQPASRTVIQTLIPDTPVTDSETAISLQKIMSDPDWLGRQPERARWSIDGQYMVYQRKQEGSVLRNWYRVSPDSPQEIVEVKDAQRHLYDSRDLVRSADGSITAWLYGDSLFVKNGSSEPLLLSQHSSYSGLSLTTNNQILVRAGNEFKLINPANGVQQTVLQWKFAEKPEAVEAPKDYLAEEQIKLIEYIAKKRTDRQVQSDANERLKTANAAYKSRPLYFDKTHELRAVSVSPALNYAVIVTRETIKTRDETDIMPHYIQEDGRIAAKSVRQRVADSKPQNHDVWLVDLTSGEKSLLSYKTLPGYNEDVLAAVKKENAQARGETYEVNRLPRPIILISSEPPLKWHSNGEHVAIMVEAWDNKDRWIASVDFDKKQLVSQHRLSDEAWISYRNNDFDWMNNEPTLFYISEETGFYQLYVKPLDGEARALTSGSYIVSDLTITNNDDFIYYVANKEHPGIYEVYRVNTATGEQEMLTNLDGLVSYALSPDEEHLLLTHSKITQPPELYASSAAQQREATRITFTVSEEFQALPWTVPQIVAIESSHVDDPVYSRVYFPKDYKNGEPRRAVVFNHGAGYLQNAHLGWSGYFREFMFHSMLAQQGYVVLDMDFRASAGYGRDWRTAIYRQMGTPEVQDLRDGVNWLVENANVDRQRIGTYGGSYGGFLTFMALFNEPDLFQAGAALRPVSDWAHYNTGYTSNILNTPDIDPIAYERSSPIYFAEGLEKPLLMNAPMVDDNVFFVDVVRLVQRLIELEKTNFFETAIYPVEPHGFVQPSSWLDEYQRIYNLFEKEL